MARFSGKSGSITTMGSNAVITKWDIDAVGDVLDVTGMDSGGVKEFIAGLKEWSGTLSAFPTGDISTWAPGSSFSAVAFASGSTGAPKLTGNVIVKSLKISTSVDGVVSAEVSFQGTGTLTYGVV